MANVSYSCSDDNDEENRMKKVYKNEMHHFLASINPHSTDMRFFVPGEMIEALAEILISDLEREEISREWKQI